MILKPENSRDAVKRIEQSLSAGLLKKGPEEAFQPFVRVAKTNSGDFVGGVHAYTSHGWLAVDVLAVEEAYWGQGHGSHLLAAAEKWGRSQGCSNAKLETFYEESFFLNRGYRTYAKLDDYPRNGAFYYMRKSLVT